MKMQDKMQDKTKEYAASLRKFLARKLGSFGEWLKEYFGTLWQIFALPQLCKSKWQQLKSWRPQNLSRAKIAAATALLLMLVLAFSLQLYSNSMIGKLQSQQAAERWRGDNEMSFGQASLFLPAGESWQETDIFTLREKLDKNLVDSGVIAAEEQTLWIDAYASSVRKLKVGGDYGEAEAQVITVGGDWFFFHPLQLRSGGYISSDDLMDDRIVINEQLAWRLFGAVDVSGMEATINGNKYYVAGVVKSENDKLTQKAYDGGAMMFMLFGAKDAAEDITSYELVSPEPFVPYTSSFLSSCEVGEVVDNGHRFDFMESLYRLLHPAERAVQDSGVAYPYWENAARVAEVRLMVLVLWRLLLLALPLAVLVVLLWRGFRAVRRYCKLKWQEFSLTR